MLTSQLSDAGRHCPIIQVPGKPINAMISARLSDRTLMGKTRAPHSHRQRIPAALQGHHHLQPPRHHRPHRRRRRRQRPHHRRRHPARHPRPPLPDTGADTLTIWALQAITAGLTLLVGGRDHRTSQTD